MVDDFKNNAELTVLDFAGSLTKYVSGMENYPFPPSISVKTPSLDIVGNFEDKYPSGYQVLAEQANAKTVAVNSTTSMINPALVDYAERS